VSIEQLKKALGPVGYLLAKKFMRGLKVKFDTEQSQVRISKDGITHVLSFDEIERLVSVT